MDTASPYGIIALVGLAGSVSLLSGWRIYLCVLVTGLALRLGWVAPPHNLASLAVLSHPAVLSIAALGFVAEFFIDKLAWVDSVWDAVHTAIRPVGGALLALAIVDANDPAWQLITLLLGGSGALMTHAAKAGTRAIVNVSPEPFSNIAVSSTEDVATAGLLGLIFANPVAALIVFPLLFIGAVSLLLWARRILRRVLTPANSPEPGHSS
jgi:hypothetical protein